MKISGIRKISKPLSVFVAISILNQVIFPTAAWALTGGPSSPEFSSFESVATTEMVNPFTGDFTYNLPVVNIPGPEGSGYSLSLSYHSGENAETEASWVGYGWTLNPGSINRTKQGFPDDSKGDKVTYYNDVPANWTIACPLRNFELEAFSSSIPLSAELSSNISYNNYKGFRVGYSSNFSAFKGLTLGFHLNEGDGSFSYSVNANQIYKSWKAKRNAIDSQLKEYIRNLGPGEGGARQELEAEAKKMKLNNKRNHIAGFLLGSACNYGYLYVKSDIYQTNVSAYSGFSVSAAFKTEKNLAFLPVGTNPIDKRISYTRHKFKDDIELSTYGYMYSNDANNSGEYMMDYSVEKGDVFSKRDLYLSIPYADKDIFNVQGEGLGGSFTMNLKKNGVFGPNGVESVIPIFSAGVQIQSGTDNGIGVTVGGGIHKTTVSRSWGDGDENGNTNDFQFSTFKNLLNPNGDVEDEPVYFRFAGDMGGDNKYFYISAGEAPEDAELSYIDRNFIPNYPSNFTAHLVSKTEGENRSGRSSYIGFRTNTEMDNQITDKKLAYEKSSAYTDVPRSANQDDIGEFAITNSGGNHYVYGLPVYNRYEASISRGIHKTEPKFKTGCPSIVYPKKDKKYSAKIGYESNAEYASTYLLTSITTPDYIDVNHDGCSENDLGGYTQFKYQKKYGNGVSGDWYKWRIPYNGLSFSANRVLYEEDDMGSYMSGKKEVYYLQRIETKTHYAIFEIKERVDGISAADEDDNNDQSNDAASNEIAKGSGKSYYLNKISLYKKDGDGDETNDKALQVTYFQYTNELCQGLPNTTNGTEGKLTLKKVWTEYNGIVNAKINPYEFEYKYPSNTEVTYPSNYSTFYKTFSNGSQNPNYNPITVDAWGNYCEAVGTSERRNKLITWLDQTPSADFDPSAWQLKVIKLPSGGQIHIQYEQDDYMYVQNQRANVMVKLRNDIKVGFFTHETKCYIDVEQDLGIPTTKFSDYLALLNNTIIGKKIYFKFLYQLYPDVGAPSSRNCDVIDGYAKVKSCGIENNKLYVLLDNGVHSPTRVCRDYVQHEVSGKLPMFKTDLDLYGDDASIDSDPSFFTKLGYLLLNGVQTFTQTSLTSTCQEVVEDLSYLRLPTMYAKKGGGLRVKRLLMYDDGMYNKSTSSNDASSLYGTEYDYSNTDGSTSGVATNEPSGMREENVLVNVLDKRLPQNLVEKAIAGVDKEQFEGPIGEALLPGPSVGYSRIVAKGIHSGKSNSGFTVTEYHTCKDFPFVEGAEWGSSKMKPISNTAIDKELDWLYIPTGVFDFTRFNRYACQGYQFIQYNIHGYLKSIKTYGGDPKNSANQTPNSSQEITYFEPGEKLKLMNRDFSYAEDVNYDPGVETEIVMERRRVVDYTLDGTLDFDVSVNTLPIPLPFGSAWANFEYTENKLFTHVTTKIIRFPVVQKSVKVTQDGITHSTENIAFSRSTGEPLVVKTWDEFHNLELQNKNSSINNHDGSIVSYTLPASMVYKEMGQKAKNERSIIKPSGAISSIELKTSTNLYFIEINGSGSPESYMCDIKAKLGVGDLIFVICSSGSYLFNINSIVDNKINVSKALDYYTPSSPSTIVSCIEVVKSGRTNQLQNSVESFAIYGDQNSSTISNNAEILKRLDLCNKLNAAINFLETSDPNTVKEIDNYLGDLIKNNGVCINSQQVSQNKIELINTGYDGFKFKNSLLNFCNNERTIYPYNGTFILDESGEIVYNYLGCNVAKICLQFCSPIGIQVLSVGVSTYSDTYNNIAASTNEYESGAKGRWHPLAIYTYKENIKSAHNNVDQNNNTLVGRNYLNSGTFAMQPFNFSDLSKNDQKKWLLASQVILFNEHGSPIEDQNFVGMSNSVLLGYSGILPVITAQNSEQSSLYFESFENVYHNSVLNKDYVEWQQEVVNANISNNFHSGRKSYQLATGISNAFTLAKSFKILKTDFNSSLRLMVWVKEPIISGNSPIRFIINSTNNIAAKKVARSGEWALYEAAYNVLNTNPISIGIENISNSTIFIDDIRIQPSSSQANCFVYDVNTFKLLTSFDDQHFGLYYQYNQEGQLVRTLIETEKGMKTIKETQYNLPNSIINRPLTN